LEGALVFNRKQVQFEPSDFIDLLLDADEATRRQLVFQAVQSGTLSRSEADDLMAQTTRLERVAGPRLTEPTEEAVPQTAWGIDYP
jgi:hypothetical protein